MKIDCLKMKLDVIAFGSATLDLFIETGLVLEDKELCFPFASKVDIEGLAYETGGGGTNVAAGLSLLGLKTAYCGVVGTDFAGNEVKKALEETGVDTSFLVQKEDVLTNFSVVFPYEKDRTVFVWKDASEALNRDDVPWDRLSASWLYLAPLSNKLSELFTPLVRFAHDNGMKVMANPGNSQLGMEEAELKKALNEVDILLLNREEASMLTGVPYKREKKLFKELDRLIDGLAIMTRGRRGVIASDGDQTWEVPALEVEVVEKTGAGDAFASGFLSQYISSGSVERALESGVANASGCIQKRGAKKGLTRV